MPIALGSLLMLGFKASELYNEMCEDVLKQYDLSIYERDVMLFLRSGKVDTSSDIVKYRKLSKSLVCKATSSLVARGFIDGVRDETDKRIVHLVLTQKGREVTDKLDRIVADYLDIMKNGVPDEELESFKDTACKLIGNVNAYFADKE